jgi:hypothetical protein
VTSNSVIVRASVLRRREGKMRSIGCVSTTMKCMAPLHRSTAEIVQGVKSGSKFGLVIIQKSGVRDDYEWFSLLGPQP